MFSITFLGHQGWLFEAGESRVLVDPLLTEGFCEAGRVGTLYPPRTFEAAAFPAIDAVLFTHEHNDHFAIPTLNRIDRRMPIYLSARCSRAARTILDEMGFTSARLVPGGALDLGSLRFHFFSPDHTRADNGDEWDVLPYLVHDVEGHGSFMSHVDVMPQAHVDDAMRAASPKPGVWCFTNNASHWAFSHAGGGPPQKTGDETAQLLAQTLTYYTQLRSRWGSPAAVVWCGGGMAFEGERSWLNHNVFPIDSERICAGMRAVLPDVPQLVPLPGQTLHMVDGRLARTERRAFLGTRPHQTWPDRSFIGDVTRLGPYAPACGRHEFQHEDIAELSAELNEFARYLYGGPLFRRLYSCDHAAVAPRKASFVWVLMADDAGGAYVYEYDPQGCRFIPAEGNPVRDYLGGIECWASDLLAVCRGELASSAIPFGRGRVWNVGDHAGITFHEYCQFFHPLRRPDTFLTLYRRLLAADGEQAPVVRAANRGG